MRRPTLALALAFFSLSLTACASGFGDDGRPQGTLPCAMGDIECTTEPDAAPPDEAPPDAAIPADLDTDGDLVPDLVDTAPNDPSVCGDRDRDGCEDCSRGVFNLVDDGPNQDGDLLCDAAESFLAGTRAVAGTADGELLYSDDRGASWQVSPTSPAPHAIADIAYGLGRYIAVGAAGTILLSDDGVNWSPAIVAGGDSVDFRAVLHAEIGWWAVVGTGGTVGLSFDNGSTWVIAPGKLGASELIDIAYDYDHRRWLVLDPTQGAIHTASLVQTPVWSTTRPSAGSALAGIDAEQPGWLTVNRAGITQLSSDDGGSWNRAGTIPNAWDYVDVATARRSFVASASTTLPFDGSAPSSFVFSSDDGTAWDKLIELPNTQVTSVAHDYGDGLQLLGARDGQIFAYPFGEFTATATQATDSAVAGIATNSDGAVVVRLQLGASAGCDLNGFPVSGATKRIHRIDIQPGSAGKPILFGAPSGTNNRIYLQANLRIRTAGDYQFRLRLAGQDVAQLVIDGSEVIAGGGCYGSRTGAAPGLTAGIHNLEIFWGDDGFADRITLEYAGPDTGGDFVTVPRHAFAP